jgi:hypothetical protein
MHILTLCGVLDNRTRMQVVVIPLTHTHTRALDCLRHHAAPASSKLRTRAPPLPVSASTTTDGDDAARHSASRCVIGRVRDCVTVCA